MSPAPVSPLVKISSPIRTSSQDSTDGIRKRVCKACDRCRLKKSKCDGTSPCSRCRADNAICVFGERKKSHDKVYPKGYVEMLEQQQTQLVTALQEMYRRLSIAQAWTGPALSEANGHPLTHDILRSLNLLETKADGSGEVEVFEEDCQKLQSRLLADGAGYVQRRGSFSSDSDHSQHGQPRTTSHGTPALSRPEFRESFNFNSAASTPLSRSPATRQRQTYPPAQPSQLQTSPLSNDPQFYQAEWMIPDLSSPETVMQSRFAMQVTNVNQSLSQIEDMMANDQLETSPAMYDASFSSLPITSYPQQYSSAFGGSLPDFNSLDPMEIEFSKYIQVTT